MMKKLLSAVALTVAFAVPSVAATFNGKFYDVSGYGVFEDPTTIVGPLGTPLADSNAAVLAFLGTNPTPDATFTSAAIGYGAQGIGTLADFVGGANITSGIGATSFLGTILTFTGKIKLAAGWNNNFEVFSDDGFLLYINDDLAGFYDGLRPPLSSFFNVDGGAGGVADFSLIYYEGSQVEAALDVKLNGEILAPVPVPAAGFLLIGALGGLVALRRRKTA